MTVLTHLRMTFRSLLLLPLSVFCLSILLSLFCSGTVLWAAEPQNWKVPPGYGVKIDSSGWELPVAMQFITLPQSDPKAPLYYVAERRGTIKVVTQDRSVFVYADAPENLGPDEQPPDLEETWGMTGLCLDQDSGFLYTTMATRQEGQLFNKIIRFGNSDGRLALRGVKNWEIPLFRQNSSSSIPRISHCWIGSDHKIYIGVSDPDHPPKAQLLQEINGKILRINPDGTAPSDNPYYDPQAPDKITSYIYAYGLRHPSALSDGPNSQLYSVDNGLKADRLIQVVPGKNYLWDGNDASILIHGIVIWTPPLSPRSMVFLARHPSFSNWDPRLLIASATQTRIEAIQIDHQLGAIAPSEPILEYIGNQKNENQTGMPVAIGPDGIYFSSFLPQADGKTQIMKIVPDSSPQQPPAQPTFSGEGWFIRLECDSCHKIAGKGGQAGPALDNLIPQLQARLHSKNYHKQLQQMDQLTEELFVQYKEVRQKLRQLEGKEKIKFWLEFHLKEPRFDAVDSQMPNLHLTEEQITALTQYLMTLSMKDPSAEKTLPEQWGERIKFFLTTHLWLWLSMMLVLGLAIGYGLKTIFRFCWRLLFSR